MLQVYCARTQKIVCQTRAHKPKHGKGPRGLLLWAACVMRRQWPRSMEGLEMSVLPSDQPWETVHFAYEFQRQQEVTQVKLVLPNRLTEALLVWLKLVLSTWGVFKAGLHLFLIFNKWFSFSPFIIPFVFALPPSQAARRFGKTVTEMLLVLLTAPHRVARDFNSSPSWC